MNELNISPNFTVADIHKIREWNYEQTKSMSKKERQDYYKKAVTEFLQFSKKVADKPKDIN